ncbi:hypothetical protein H0A65_11085 [Alcaligenaceae bacterium]|nr:hypothetical protein [Alcaligenaceae bacterium]
MTTIQYDLGGGATFNSYMGLTRHADAHRDRARVANAARKRGHCVDAGLVKAYRRA